MARRRRPPDPPIEERLGDTRPEGWLAPAEVARVAELLRHGGERARGELLGLGGATRWTMPLDDQPMVAMSGVYLPAAAGETVTAVGLHRRELALREWATARGLDLADAEAQFGPAHWLHMDTFA